MVLEKINEVNDIKNLSWEELEVLSEEIREESADNCEPIVEFCYKEIENTPVCIGAVNGL